MRFMILMGVMSDAHNKTPNNLWEYKYPCNKVKITHQDLTYKPRRHANEHVRKHTTVSYTIFSM